MHKQEFLPLCNLSVFLCVLILKIIPDQAVMVCILSGKRACPGEQLARTELFINTVALLQRFTFQAEDPDNPPKIQGEMGSTYTPKPFRIVAVPL